MHRSEQAGGAAPELRVDWEEYYRLIEVLALQIHESGYAFDSLLCLARGGLRVGDVISRLFDRPLAVLTVSSYREAAGTRRGSLRIAAAISSIDGEPRGRVLLVDDLADSGSTLAGVVRYLNQHFAQISELRTGVIWLKGSSQFRPDYFASHLPDSPWIVQPFEVYDRLGPEQLAERLKQYGPHRR
jgi:hypoxanthine phosphoribosyltransferase